MNSQKGWRLIPFVTPDEVKEIIREERRYIPGGTVTVSREEVEVAMKAATEAKRVASMRPVPMAKIVDGTEESSAVVRTKTTRTGRPEPRELVMPIPEICKGAYLVSDKPEPAYDIPEPRIHGAESLAEVPEPTPVIDTGPQKIRTKIVDPIPGLTKVHIFEEDYEPTKKAGG